MHKYVLIFVLIVFSLTAFGFNTGNLQKEIDNSLNRCRIIDGDVALLVRCSQEFNGINYVMKNFNKKSYSTEDISEILEETETILGIENPDTIIVIDHDTTIYEDFILVNNAQLHFEDCHVVFAGIIWLLGNSELSVSNCSFHIPQDYIYQYSMIQIDSARIIFEDTEISSNNFPWTIGSAHNANLLFNHVDMNNSFITFSLTDSVNYNINYSDCAGEFVVLGENCNLESVDSDTLLIWLGFLKHSSGEITTTFDPEDFVEDFTFPDVSCDGLDYHVSIENCWNLKIAAMIEDSTDVIIRDCNLFACGSIFYGDAIETLNGFVDEAFYGTWSPELTHRDFQMINSDCFAWNFYAYDNSEITVNSSIFGEMLSMGNGKANIESAYCDGHGGHLGVGDSAEMFILTSTCITDILLEASSTTFLLYDAIYGFGKIIVKNKALCLIYASYVENDIIVEDSAVVIQADVNIPSPAKINENLQITGISNMIRGENCPFFYRGYRILFSKANDSLDILYDSGKLDNIVIDDILCIINTDDYEIGMYKLRMYYYFEYDIYGEDSINFDSEVNLLMNESILETKIEDITNIPFVYPNPIFELSSIKISNIPPNSSFELVDINGRVIYKSCTGNNKTISINPKLQSGVYLLNFTNDKTLLNIKIFVY